MLSRYHQSLVISLTMMVLLVIPLNQEIVSAETSKEVAYADKMEDYVKTQMETYKIPGMSIAIVKDGQVDYLQGFGVKNPNGEKVTPDTPFLLASVSKSFIAVAIMQLAEEGKLNVDDLVIKHLPSFDVAGNGENQITISHLLYHTSGFSELGGVEAIIIPDEENALEIGVRNLASAELAFNPGEQFEYSNLNYNVLGLIVQEVSGQPFEEYIEQHIFTPLEMNHSFTSMAEARENGATSGYYPFFGIPIVYDNYMVSSRATLPAGGLWSSASDMSQYMLAYLNSAETENLILSSASTSKLFNIGFEIDPSYGFGYAMGLFHADGFWDKELLEKQNTELNQYDFEQLNTYWHEGDWANYKSVLLFVPEHNFGVVALMNTNDHTRTSGFRYFAWDITLIATGGQAQYFPTSEETMVRYSKLWFGGLNLILIGFVFISLRQLRKFKSDTVNPALQRKKFIQYAGIPLFIDIALLGFIFLKLLPENNTSIPVLLKQAPDLGIICVMLLLLSGIWGIIRTGWFVIAWKGKSHANIK